MKNRRTRILSFLLAAVLLITLAEPAAVSAATPSSTSKILLSDDIDEQIDLTYGNSGTITLDTSAEPYTFYDSSSIVSVTYTSADTSILTINSTSGSYSTKGYGSTCVTAAITYEEVVDWYTDEDGNEIEETEQYTDSYSYDFCVWPSTSNITLSKTSLTLYQSDDCYMDSTTAEIKIKNSDYSFSEDDDLTTLSVSSSSSKVWVYASLENNVLTLSCYGSGKSTVTVTINGKAFKISVQLVTVSCSTDSVLLYPGQTKTVKVKGKLSGTTVKWSSSNKKVATVSSSGKIKAKKNGNAVITATVGGTVKVGCVVSVTTKTKVKAIKKAIKIASTSTYSQAKRMKTGYYDCSSLVWRSYSPYGVYFGNKSRAPVAASIASYLNKKGKLKGSLTYSQVQKLTLRAGDLIFKTGANNGRYKGIYHVELFAGYALAYYTSSGKAVVTTTWAARSDGYAMSADLYGRP